MTEHPDRLAPTPLRPEPPEPPIQRAAESPATANAPTVADRWHRFDRWTSAFFVSLAVVTFVAALTVLTAAEAAGIGVLARLVGMTAAEVGLSLAAAFALDRRAGWGRTAAVGLLVIIVATDVVRVVVDLTRSTITIPLGAIVALFLLTIRPGPLARLDGRDRSVALAVVGLYLLVSLAAVASMLAGPVAAASIP